MYTEKVSPTISGTMVERREMQYENFYGLTAYEMVKKAKDAYGDKIFCSYQRKGQITNVSFAKFWIDVQHVAHQLEKRQIKGTYRHNIP